MTYGTTPLARANSDLRISEVRIRLAQSDANRCFGWASCVVNEALHLNNIAIMRRRDGGLGLKFPSVLSRNRHRHFHFNPITAEAQVVLEEAILGRLNGKER